MDFLISKFIIDNKYLYCDICKLKKLEKLDKYYKTVCNTCYYYKINKNKIKKYNIYSQIINSFINHLFDYQYH
jgi:hypothetical protein